MDSHEPRDLDGVIDDVARAMTRRAPAPDLRPAVAARIAGAPGWTSGWRAGTAAAVVAAVGVVIMVARPGTPTDPEVQRTPSLVTAPGLRSAAPPQAVEAPQTTSRRGARRVGHQTVVAAETAGSVEIRPLNIAPVEADPLRPLEQVEIAPIDVEPLTVSQLELVE